MRDDYLAHHGILGMKWGHKNGPPYPLDDADHSASERKRGWKKSLDKDKKRKIGKAAAIAGVAAIGAVSLYAIYRNDQNNYLKAASVLDYINNANSDMRKTQKYASMVKEAEGISKRHKNRYDYAKQLEQGVVDKRRRIYESLNKGASRIEKRNNARNVKQIMRNANRTLDQELKTVKRDARDAKIKSTVDAVKSGYQKLAKPAKKVADIAKKTVNGTRNFVNRRVRKQPGGRLAKYTVKNRNMYLE